MKAHIHTHKHRNTKACRTIYTHPPTPPSIIGFFPSLSYIHRTAGIFIFIFHLSLRSSIYPPLHRTEACKPFHPPEPRRAWPIAGTPRWHPGVKATVRCRDRMTTPPTLDVIVSVATEIVIFAAQGIRARMATATVVGGTGAGWLGRRDCIIRYIRANLVLQ